MQINSYQSFQTQSQPQPQFGLSKSWLIRTMLFVSFFALKSCDNVDTFERVTPPQKKPKAELVLPPASKPSPTKKQKKAKTPENYSDELEAYLPLFEDVDSNKHQLKMTNHAFSNGYGCEHKNTLFRLKEGTHKQDLSGKVAEQEVEELLGNNIFTNAKNFGIKLSTEAKGRIRKAIEDNVKVNSDSPNNLPILTDRCEISGVLSTHIPKEALEN